MIDKNKSHIFLRQVFTLTEANLKTRYRNTFAGILWVALYPMMMFGVQAVVFHYILKIQIENYLLFLLSGLLPWVFLSQTLEMNTSMIVNNSRLLKSFPIHPLVPIFAQVLDNLLNFALLFFFILLPAAIFYQGFSTHLILLPVAIVSLFVAATAISFILAIFQIFFYDTRFLISFVMSFMFYLTPIFYSANLMGEELRKYLFLNPFYYFIAPFQEAFRQVPLTQYTMSLIFSVLMSLLFTLVAVLYWKRRKQELYFRL